MATEILIKGLPNRALPQAYPDNYRDGVPLRVGRYGAMFTESLVLTKHGLTDEGTMFTTQNTAVGTALALSVQASFVNTTAELVYFNTADPAQTSSPYLYLDKIKMMFTVAPATSTGTRYAVVLDNASRVPSAGQTLLVGSTSANTAQPGAVNVGSQLRQSVARIWSFTGGAALTVPAPSANSRVVAMGGMDNIPVVGGERAILFGAPDAGSTAQNSATNAVAVPPGWYAVVHIWFPGNATTGASIEWELAWWER